MSGNTNQYTSVELCAGAGGQAVGLHRAGFAHEALVEIDPQACETLRANVVRLGWKGCQVWEEDLSEFAADQLDIPPRRLSLLAGGVPCPPFSMAGKQLGEEDERDLFPAMLRMVRDLQPRAVMIENVRGLLEPEEKFAAYRSAIRAELAEAGYQICEWNVMEARDYGVPQLRPRAILVAMRERDAAFYEPPIAADFPYTTVAAALKNSMRQRFETAGHPESYDRWLAKSELRNTVAPTLVGGSKKHGGADLGPTRAKRAWEELGVDAHGVANDPEDMKDPERDLLGNRGPKLTVAQAALIQGFPPEWVFKGRKTARYRQVGNAFPPPVAEAVGRSIVAALRAADENGEDLSEMSSGTPAAHSGSREPALAR